MANLGYNKCYSFHCSNNNNKGDGISPHDIPMYERKVVGYTYIDVCMCRRVCMSNANLIWRARSSNLLLPLLDDDDDDDDDDAWKSSIVECNNV